MEKIQQFIIRFLDFFYPLFKSFFNKQTYYYTACGGANTLFGFVVYYLIYHNYLHKENFHFFILTFEPHIASIFLTTSITFLPGFFLTKYIVWSESSLSTKKQFFRHLNLVIIFSFINYGLLKLFVDSLGFWAMPSQILTTVIIIVFSYLSQKHISFKKK
jgi:putative flippase GtrA